MSLPTWCNRLTLTAAVASAAIGICALTLFNSEPQAATEVRSFGADVKRVISGNRFKTESGESVVYAGIRAPFKNDPLGDQALELNRRLIEGKTVRLRFDEAPKDDKDRWLAYVFVDGVMVNEQMVAEGLAYVQLKEHEQRFGDELLAAQREAQAARRGLWKNQVQSQGAYPGDRKHAVFHRADCNDVANTRPGEEMVFDSKQAAFDAGFAPCGHCNP